MIDLTQILGWTATFLFSIMIIPQMIRTVKSKDTSGVSLLMFIIFMVANIIALTYALLIHQFPLIIKYIIALVTTVIYIVLYWTYYQRKNKITNKTAKLNVDHDNNNNNNNNNNDDDNNKDNNNKKDIKQKKGTILWFTGLSGSGKTTIAEKLKVKLEQQGKKAEILDGDVVRATLHKNLGFKPEDIHENNRLLSILAEEKSEEADFVLLPIISPFQEDRQKARSLFGKSFVEVFIDASLEECIRRDVKGHYKKALAGKINNFIGIAKDNPYERPLNPEITLETSKMSIEDSVKKILEFITKREGN